MLVDIVYVAWHSVSSIHMTWPSAVLLTVPKPLTSDLFVRHVEWRLRHFATAFHCNQLLLRVGLVDISVEKLQYLHPFHLITSLILLVLNDKKKLYKMDTQLLKIAKFESLK